MMKGISSIIAILGLCVIMTVKAVLVDDTGSHKEMTIIDNSKVFNNCLTKEQQGGSTLQATVAYGSILFRGFSKKSKASMH